MAGENIESNLEVKILKINSESPEIDDFPEEFLTSEDVKRLIGVAEEVRDKALISMLWETGARLSEIYELKVGSFTDWKEGKKVIINGFTGERKLPLIESVSVLDDWLSTHPRNDHPDEPLWCWTDQEEGKTGEKVTYNFIRKMIRDVVERAGIGEFIGVDHFRRSRMAFLARKFDNNEMKQWFGWSGEKDLSGLSENCSDCSGCPFSCSMKGRI